MNEKKIKIIIVAGDPSGDLHGAHLASKIKELNPVAEIYSAAGSNLAGCSRQIVDLTQIAVTGIFEVLTYFSKILKIFNDLVRRIVELEPAAVVLIDFPDFNLRLAKKLKARGLKVIYYISPQIWAWRKNRIKLVERYVDKMIVIFPFEEEFYRRHGVKAKYVGHPLIESVRTFAEGPKELITFLPGSRRKEVLKHLPLMIAAKKLLEGCGLKFAALKHPGLVSELFAGALAEDIEVNENKDDLFSRTFVAVTSSGTATLELALAGIPSVVIYKMGFLSWLILKNIVNVDFIAMANIIAKEKVMPELIQYRATPANIASECRRLIEDKQLYALTKKKLVGIKEVLGEEPASLNAARRILEEISNEGREAKDEGRK